MAQRIAYMNLDQPWYLRYWDWLMGVGKCFALQCDLGTNVQGVQVSGLLGAAASSTLRLVILATVLAAIFGIAIGVLTAVRQYSGLDYGVTFLTFLFFSLPVFWAAVMLKEYMAIGYNNWIKEPSFTPLQTIVAAVLFGFLMQVFLAGSVKRRVITFAVSAVFVGVAIPYLLWLNFFRYPQLGLVGIVVLSLAVALSGTAMTVGVRNKAVLYPALITVGLGIILYYATFSILQAPSTPVLIIGGVLSMAIPGAIGYYMGGRVRKIAMWVSAFTGLGRRWPDGHRPHLPRLAGIPAAQASPGGNHRFADPGLRGQLLGNLPGPRGPADPSRRSCSQ